MAVVTAIEMHDGVGEAKRQPTEVIAKYKTFERDGRKFLQIDTYGSKVRKKPGKQSQTLQFDRDSAEALWKILGTTFGLGKP